MRFKPIRLFSIFFAFLTVFVFFTPTTVLALGTNDYIIENGKRVPIPISYLFQESYEYFDSLGTLNSPQDLFASKTGYLYVADTGNNRILKLSSDGKALEEYTVNDGGGLNSPEGIYVTDNGEIYIADTGNMRVVHLDENGKFLQEITKPDSVLLDDNFRFTPKKIAVSSTGIVYVLCKTEAQGLLSLDTNGEFRGFIGMQPIEFRWSDLFVRIFGSKEQKKLIAKQLPAPITSFTLFNDLIYAVVGSAKYNQAVIYNSIGKNLLPDGFYGEKGFLGAVTGNGKEILGILDTETGLIYEYSKSGDNIAIFGGLGNRKGEFIQPTSIVTIGSDYLVLDKGKGQIIRFSPTYFTKLVHNAIELSADGKYIEAAENYYEVLEIDESYTLAHKGIAKAYYKEGKWEESKEIYKYVKDKEGYSKAFSEYILSLYRAYFGWFVLGIGLLLTVGTYAFIKLKKYADKTIDDKVG